MAEFLTTSEINSELEAIIKGAGDGLLVLISPYIKLKPRIKVLLEDQVRHGGANVYVMYGKEQIRPDIGLWLASNDIRMVFRENLHAKCYLNDSHALVTSMNLHEHSQENNEEMGVLASAEDDPDLYRAIRNEAEALFRQSGIADLTATLAGEIGEEQHGYCLRGGEAIPFNLNKPFCNSHYTYWIRFKDSDYPENYCHRCGKRDFDSTSMAKPLCKSCYRKSQAATKE